MSDPVILEGEIVEFITEKFPQFQNGMNNLFEILKMLNKLAEKRVIYLLENGFHDDDLADDEELNINQEHIDFIKLEIVKNRENESG